MATIEDTLISIDSHLGAIRAMLSQANVPSTPVFIPAANVEAGTAAVEAAGLTAAQQEPLPAAQKRGRGRPKATETAAAAPIPTSVSVAVPTPVVQAAAPAAPAADFLAAEAPVATERAYALPEVRAALAVVQAQKGQAEALKLFKESSGLDTLAKLQPANYGKVFNAAIPAGRFAITDVRSVLVKANERKNGAGLDVLKAHGANTIGEVKEDQFVAIILAAHAVQ